MSAVYRVETPSGGRPYCREVLARFERLHNEVRGPEPEPPEPGAPGSQEAWEAYDREWSDWCNTEPPVADLRAQPSPGVRWMETLYSQRLGDYVDYSGWIIFGCPTVASLCAWFRGWGVHLSTLGFVVREYDTEVLWSMVHREANGLAQCVFDRRSAKIVATHDPANFIY